MVEYIVYQQAVDYISILLLRAGSKMTSNIKGLLIMLLILADFSFTYSEKAFPHPVGFWMFDHVYGGRDLSGNGNDAVLYNTEWTSGPFGTPNRAVLFTGADDQSSRAEIPNTNRALSVNHSFTWLTYIKDLDSTKSGPIYSLGKIGGFGHIFWKCCPTGTSFHPRLDTSHNGPPAWVKGITDFFSQDEWMQVAVTYNQPNGVIRIYQGTEERVDERGSYSADLDDDWDTAYVAAAPGDSREIHGSMFCMMYFGNALSREELSAAFSLCRTNEAQSLYPWPSPLAHWPLNSYFGANNAAEGINKDGVGNHFSLYRGPDGREDNSYYFRDSLSSYVTIDNTDGLLDVNSFTLSAWIKPGSGTGPIFRVWLDTGGVSSTLHIWKHPTKTQLYLNHRSRADGGESPVVTPVGSLQLYKWNHIAVSYDYGLGMAYLYINDILHASTDIGSHVTKIGPVLSLVGWPNGWSGSRDTYLACVQWFDHPLSPNSLSKVKKECEAVHKSYRPPAKWMFPFSRVTGLRDKKKLKTATSSTSTLTFVDGYRHRPEQALLLDTDQTLTLPAAATTTTDNMFTLAVHIQPHSGTDIDLLEGVISLTYRNVTIRFNSEVYYTYTVIADTEEFTWLGAVYEGDLGVLTVYIDGDPVIVEYIGHREVTLPTSPTLTNRGGATAIQCYQLYTEALHLRQFVHTRDACIVPSGTKSLPYPRGFWPMNHQYRYKELTGRSADLVPLANSNIAFGNEGPNGQKNSAATLDGTSENATLYVPQHRGLHVRFSVSVCLWIKIHTSFPADRRINIFSWRPTRDADFVNKDDPEEVGFSIIADATADGIHIVIQTSSTDPKEFPHSLQRDQWIHISVVHDFLGKSTSLYLNGELKDTQRTNRHILKTFRPIVLGGLMDFDTAGVSINTSQWKSDHSIACVQLYDMALSKEQIPSTMSLCNTEVLQSIYTRHRNVGKGMSMDQPDYVLKSNSLTHCATQCQRDGQCLSIGYGSGECDLTGSRRDDLTDSDYTETGDEYLEKMVKPWRLFY